jgi:serine/threonine-protein kinase
MDGPSGDAIVDALQRLLDGPQFAGSPRASRFMKFVVEATLAGRGGGLKEYVLGVEVFDRAASFDPRIDTIVRVEAVKLRKRVQAYYRGSGRKDPVIIELPKGGYVPQFRVRSSRTPRKHPSAPQTLKPAQPISNNTLPQVRVESNTVAVLPFANLSSSSDNDYFTDGLTEELIHALTRLRGMSVLAWNSAARMRNIGHDFREVRRQLRVAHVLTGSARISGPSLRVRAQLVDTATGAYKISLQSKRKLLERLSEHCACAWPAVRRAPLWRIIRPAPFPTTVT